jgi:branched-chain amino acid transport system substrate-binding protein
MRFSPSRIGRAAAAVACAFVLTGPLKPAAAAPASGTPITVGVILSITGPYAPLGEPERNAFVLAEKEINEQGGVNGRPIKFLIENDEGKADTAAQLATSLIGQNVALIIGGSLTPTSAAIARVTGDKKVFQIYMTPTKQLWDARTGISKYLFEATPANELEAVKLLAYARSKLKMKKMALMHDDAPYGTQGSAIVKEEAARQDVNIVADEPFPITATDVTAQLGRVKASGADTVFIWTASPVAALTVRQIRQLGLKVNVVGSTGIVSNTFLTVTGKDGEGVLADMDLNVSHPNKVQADFLAAYEAAYKGRPANFASFAWDAAHLAALVLAKAKGKTDGDSLAAALIALKPYGGTTGTYKYSEIDHNGLKPDDIHMAVDRNGVWETF